MQGAALRRGLLAHRYEELAVSGVHALMVRDLPVIHHDPFDRMLVVQARHEGLMLLTSDALVVQYPGRTELA